MSTEERQVCVLCLGTGQADCNLCGGSGKLQPEIEDVIIPTCHWCDGSGWHSCPRDQHDEHMILMAPREPRLEFVDFPGKTWLHYKDAWGNYVFQRRDGQQELRIDRAGAETIFAAMGKYLGRSDEDATA